MNKIEKDIFKNFVVFLMTPENIKLKTLEMTFEGAGEFRGDANQIRGFLRQNSMNTTSSITTIPTGFVTATLLCSTKFLTGFLSWSV